MKNNFADKLKASLESERKSMQQKSAINLDERFTKADNALNKLPISTDKINVIRDTFTLPIQDYKLIEECKNRLLDNKFSVTKSEIIRAGVILLNNLNNNELTKALQLVEKVKTGRPKT